MYGSKNDGEWFDDPNGAMFIGNELRSCNFVGLFLKWDSPVPGGVACLAEAKHVITAWGDDVAAGEGETITENPTSVWVTDSDRSTTSEGPPGKENYACTWDGGNSRWYIDYFVGGDPPDPYLWNVVTLSQRASSCDPDSGNIGCWSGCLDCNEADAGCSTAVTSDVVGLTEATNLTPIHLALVQGGDKINRFQEAVRDILTKDPPAKTFVEIANVQEAINQITTDFNAQGPSHVVIFGHGSAGKFKIGEDYLNDTVTQDKFVAGVKGKIKALTLYGCHVGQGDKGQAFLKKLTAGLQCPVHTWEGKVYAFGNDAVIPGHLQNRFFVEAGTDKKDIPAVTEWGIVVMLLLVLAAGTVVLIRRRAVTAR